MRLARLDIRRLPGIDAPFTLGEAELGPGVTVIHGPNGSGKSSLVRAVRAVLWPALVPSEGIEIEAQFREGDTRWHVRREGSLVRWTRDGAASAAPELPSADLARSFLVGLEELARAEARDFEGEIRRQMSGGIDFDALAAEHRWHEQSARGKRRDLDGARSELREIERAQKALQERVDQLGELERQNEEAERQAADLPILDALLELRTERAAQADSLAQLAMLPPGLERVSGSELTQLGKLRERERALQQQVRDANEAERRERAQLAKLDLASFPSATQRGALSSARERWALAEARFAETERALAHHEQACESARAACPGDLSEEALARADFPVGLDLERLVRDAQGLAAEAAALEAELALLPAAPATKETENLPTALAALRSWLNAPEAQERGSNRGHEALLPLVLLALAVFALGIFVHPAAFAALTLVAFLAWRTLARPRESATQDHRRAFEAQYDALGLGRIEWERSRVEARFNELDERRRKLDDERLASVRRAELLRRREALRPRESELEARREELRSSFGLELELGTFELATLASALAKFREAGLRRSGAEGEHRDAREKRDAAAQQFRSLFAQFSKEPVQDALEAAEALTLLLSRAQAAEKAQAALEQAVSLRVRSERELTVLKEDETRLWSELALQPGDEAGLKRRIDALPAWNNLQKELDHRRRNVDKLESRLGGRRAEAEEGEDLLRRRRDVAKEAQQRREDLVVEIRSLRVELEREREGRRFEKAAAEEARRRSELARELAIARGHSFATLLLEEVRAEFERDSQPKVLVRSDATLHSFTHGRYGLRGLSDGQLLATDAQTGRELALAQLSSGTRAQLLLALHLAFAGEASSGLKPPLFLDDSLATTDAARQRAIGEALVQATTTEGFQCFLLTREPGDVALLAGAAPTAVRTLDLAALRRLQAPTLARPAFALPAPPRLPDPTQVDAVEFGAHIGVPPLDGRASVDATHLYYVMRDELIDLKRLLELRIEHVGVLRQRLADGVELLERDVRGRVEAWTGFTASVLAAWRTGRGKPIEPEFLASRELSLTDTALEGVTALAGEVGWDAKRIVAELETRKIGRQKLQQQVRDRIREQFERNGYLDPASVLDREQAWARVLESEPTLTRVLDSAALRSRFEWLWGLLEPAT